MSSNSAEGSLPSDAYDTKGAAIYVGCSAAHLKKLRLTGEGPPFHRLFRRKGIVYQRQDLDAWRSARRFGSTTEYPESFR